MTTNCQWCGLEHKGKCHLIKAIEYTDDGQIARIEFFGPTQFPTPVPSMESVDNDHRWGNDATHVPLTVVGDMVTKIG